MGPLFAAEMVNYFPQPTHVEVRKGFSVAQTKAVVAFGTVNGFVKYGETSLWAAINDSASGTVLKNVVSGATQSVPSIVAPTIFNPVYTQFANSGGTYVAVIFRDVSNDNYYTFDGTTWTSRTAATTNGTTLISICAFKNRLWFLNSLRLTSAYYLPTSAITGTPIEFPLGGVMSKGGTLYAMGAWTRDGAEGGSDDLIVFTTTSGQVIVYQGSDPSSPATFGLVGVFDISRPIGRPFRYGADLLMPTIDGLYSMTEILNGNISEEFAVSNMVRSKWKEYAALVRSAEYGDTKYFEGVSIAYSGTLNQLLFKFRIAPIDTEFYDNVASADLSMNTITKAWTVYSGVDGYSHDTLKGDVYFGNIQTSGSPLTAYVYKFGTANTDTVTTGNEAAITAYCRQAYNYLGMAGTNKQITGIKASFTTTGTTTNGWAIDVDFKNALTSSSPTQASYVAGSYTPIVSYPALGDAIAIYTAAVLAATGSSSHKWYSTSLLYIPGGFV